MAAVAVDVLQVTTLPAAPGGNNGQACASRGRTVRKASQRPESYR